MSFNLLFDVLDATAAAVRPSKSRRLIRSFNAPLLSINWIFTTMDRTPRREL